MAGSRDVRRGWYAGEVEEALAQVYAVTDDGRKAFRARIRHMRNLGVPNVRKVGRGRQVIFDVRAVESLFMSLELTNAGIAPAIAANWILTVWSFIGDRLLDGEPDWLILRFAAFSGGRTGEGAGAFAVTCSEAEISHNVQKLGSGGFVLAVNAKGRVKALHDALAEV